LTLSTPSFAQLPDSVMTSLVAAEYSNNIADSLSFKRASSDDILVFEVDFPKNPEKKLRLGKGIVLAPHQHAKLRSDGVFVGEKYVFYTYWHGKIYAIKKEKKPSAKKEDKE
jgi:hypothetical protein